MEREVMISSGMERPERRSPWLLMLTGPLPPSGQNISPGKDMNHGEVKQEDRPEKLTGEQKKKVKEILDSGPGKYDYSTDL